LAIGRTYRPGVTPTTLSMRWVGNLAQSAV
jgi:hypothetical protein